jgi:hypothetical protein
MTVRHNCPDHKDFRDAITKSDTDGEVSFVGTRTLTNLFFRPVPKVYCVYF